MACLNDQSEVGCGQFSVLHGCHHVSSAACALRVTCAIAVPTRESEKLPTTASLAISIHLVVLRRWRRSTRCKCQRVVSSGRRDLGTSIRNAPALCSFQMFCRNFTLAVDCCSDCAPAELPAFLSVGRDFLCTGRWPRISPLVPVAVRSHFLDEHAQPDKRGTLFPQPTQCLMEGAHSTDSAFTLRWLHCTMCALQPALPIFLFPLTRPWFCFV